MGAIANVPEDKTQILEPLLACEFEDSELKEETIRELCEAGFFVPVDIKERALVDEILKKESKSGFHVIILPHENCNFRCVYCYEKFERGKMKPDIAAGLKTFIAGKVEEIKTLSIAWFGGEPLLARSLIYDLSDSFLHSCEQNGVTYTSGITTNGYFLTADVVDSLIERRITSYQVTLDGPEKLHNQSRRLAGGGDTYKKILNNLSGMRNRSESFSVKIRVNFGKQHSAQLMDEFLSEIQSLFKGDSRFDLHFHPVGRWGGQNDSNLDVCNSESIGAVRAAFMKQSLDLGFSNHMAKQHLRPHGNVCYAGKETSLVVGSDGKIYKCTVAFDDPRNHVGKITKYGELLINQERWDLWTKLDDKNVGKCTSCSFSPTCQSRGCPLAAMNQEEPPCPITEVEYEDTVKLVAGVF